MSIPSVPLTLSAVPALVVDDEGGVRELLAEHLAARGIQVTAVSDGAAALEAIGREAGRFGLVFADLHLPKFDGMAVLEAARAANASAYVVIIKRTRCARTAHGHRGAAVGDRHPAAGNGC